MAWTAQVMVSCGEGGVRHVMIGTAGDDKADALAGVKELFGLFTEGKDFVVRRHPEASSERNFDTQEWQHRGFARISLTGRDLAVESAA